MKDMKKLTTVMGLCLAAMIPLTGAVAAEKADYIFKNGTVYTMENKNPKAQAIAVTGKKIAYVGSNQGVNTFIGKKTKVIDLKGKTVFPGFVDAHDHMVSALWISQGADLSPAQNPQELARILKDYMAAHPDEKIVRGMGWNQKNAGGMPTAKQLDAIIPDKPAILIDYSCHEAWLNSKALELGGVDKNTPDLKPGTTYWVRDDQGNPTGVAIEGQWTPTFVKLGLWKPETMVKASADVLFGVAKRNGVTTLMVPGFVTPNVVKAQESMDDYEKIMALLAQWEKEGNLPMRLITLPWFKNPKLEPVQVADFAVRMREKYHSDNLRTGGVKIHPETNWTSWGAPMLEPYSNKDTKGEFGVTPERLTAMALEANKRGLDVFIHADGSATIRAAINAIEASRKAGFTDERNGIAHLSWCHPDDYKRIVAMKIPINITPGFFNDWTRQDIVMEEFLGKKRIETEASVYADLVREGVNVSISADFPSTTLAMQAPLYVVESAVTFQDPQSPTSKPFPPNRKPMSLDQALRAVTIDAAWQLRMENKVGSLAPGKYADLVILEKDPHDVAPREIADIQVVKTMMGGKLTFDREQELAGKKVIHVKVTNPHLQEAIDVKNLNLLVQNEMGHGFSICGHHELEKDTERQTDNYFVPDDVYKAFSTLPEQGYLFARPARAIYWKKHDAIYWIQWTLKDKIATLWAYDPDAKRAVEILQVKDK